MLSKERLITYSIIFILLSTLIYFVFLGDERICSEDYNVKINALEAKVDSLYHSVNDHLVFKIDTLNQEINKIRPRNWSTRQKDCHFKI